ncbi:hypothetical protein ACHQM5_024032 [Ranunculus cassubicifolius]
MLGFLKSPLNSLYVIFGFCAALVLGACKAILFGPIASLIIIFGDVGVILVIFPYHAAWTVYTLAKTNRFDIPLKIAILFGLPVLFGLWLGLGIVCSVLIGLGYGFFTPWISTFEAFRQQSESGKFLHCIQDGTWDTVRGSCTVVRDFFDLCYHSYPVYLDELRDVSGDDAPRTLRFVHIPACIAVGLIGLAVEIPLYTIIAVVKSPYLLFVGWYRLLHDLISREGPFLEAACIPIAGLTILFWPLIVVGSVVLAILASIFVGLYGSVVVYQERSFRRGAAYVVAMVATFDEYTNDWLYLRDGSILPKPRFRKKLFSHSTSVEISVGESRRGPGGGKFSIVPTDAPAMLVPTLGPSRSVREVIHEVKVIQIWDQMMSNFEMKGKMLVDEKVIIPSDLIEWSRLKRNTEDTIISVGLPAYALLQSLQDSIKAGVNGFLMANGTDLNHFNRPQDRLLDWFFQPIMVLKDQIKAINLSENETRYLEKVVLLLGDTKRIMSWENSCSAHPDPIRVAQIEGISRRLIGIQRSISKLPTYRRKYSQVVKALVSHSLEREGSSKSVSVRSMPSIDIV